MALEAGVDLSLWDEVFPFLEESVEKGILDEKVVDDAVSMSASSEIPIRAI